MSSLKFTFILQPFIRLTQNWFNVKERLLSMMLFSCLGLRAVLKPQDCYGNGKRELFLLAEQEKFGFYFACSWWLTVGLQLEKQVDTGGTVSSLMGPGMHLPVICHFPARWPYSSQSPRIPPVPCSCNCHILGSVNTSVAKADIVWSLHTWSSQPSDFSKAPIFMRRSITLLPEIMQRA